MLHLQLTLATVNFPLLNLQAMRCVHGSSLSMDKQLRGLLQLKIICTILFIRNNYYVLLSNHHTTTLFSYYIWPRHPLIYIKAYRCSGNYSINVMDGLFIHPNSFL